jgi:thioredoxin reductase
MKNFPESDVIIVGGSYAGLSAAMALGRALRSVLIIDSGKPCNAQTPHSHNFITQDGNTPKAIAASALDQVLKYDTVKLHSGVVTHVSRTIAGFEVTTEKDEVFRAKKLLFSTGLKDEFPPIDGFKECWGISVLHCPYCHGYEVRHQSIGVLGNGDIGYEFSKLISNWTGNLTLYTNGAATLTAEQIQKLEQHQIRIEEKEIASFQHEAGAINSILFKDGSRANVSAMFARIAFKQHCQVPEALGCELTEQGLIKTDDFQRTTVPGIFAAGDNTSLFRAVSGATASGTKAGAFINMELIGDLGSGRWPS